MKHQQSNLANFWVLAINEYRICAQFSRTKFILTLAFFVCAWYLVVVTLSHMHSSGVAPMFGVISPRYLASLLGGSFLALCSLGVLVLALCSLGFLVLAFEAREKPKKRGTYNPRKINFKMVHYQN